MEKKFSAKIIWIKIGVLIFIFFSNAIILFAQPPALPSDPESAPIDGGLTVLISAGIGFGVKKIKERRKKNASPNS